VRTGGAAGGPISGLRSPARIYAVMTFSLPEIFDRPATRETARAAPLGRAEHARPYGV